MDLDGLLNYEQDCYNKGYEDGIEAGKLQGHTEGRELGIQTGYQRYLAMGVLQARVNTWSGEKQKPSDQLNTLNNLVQADRFDNDPGVVEDVDRRIKLAKNKARILAASLKAPKVDPHEQKISFHRGDDDTTAIEDIY